MRIRETDKTLRALYRSQNKKQKKDRISVAEYKALELEVSFQADVDDRAEKLGWIHYHTHNSRGSDKGFPDLCAVRGNRTIFAELKREGENPTPKQKMWLEALEKAGQEVYLWRPSDWSEIEKVLR